MFIEILGNFWKFQKALNFLNVEKNRNDAFTESNKKQLKIPGFQTGF